MIKDERMLEIILNIGQAMLENGAEVKRVEETMSRIGRAYGAKHMDTFVITSSIVVSMSFENGSFSRTRRIRKTGDTDFKKLEEINALSRKYCEEPFDMEELSERFSQINKKKMSDIKKLAGSILAAGALAVFFGGTVLDGLTAAVFACLICVLQKYFSPLCDNIVFFNFITSLLTGILIGLVAVVIPINSDKVMIGDIMLLIPGIAFTNAVRDVFVGDTITGIMRLAESLLWAAAIAAGFMISFIIL